MYPFYYPSSSYTPSYPSSSYDADYFRALAEERAAREQLVAAQRAQEEARQRAARARAARRAYTAPYSSFHDDGYNDLDLDVDLNGGAYYPQQRPLSHVGNQPYNFLSSPQFSTIPQFSSSPYGFDPRQQRALLEEQQKRELLGEQRRREVLELERERRRQEEERLRRLLQEERQREEAERRRILEEERARRVLEEEKLRRAIEEEKLHRATLEEEAARRERERTPLRSQQASLEPLLRALGFVPAGVDSDSDQERLSHDARNGRGMRAHTASPNPRRASAAPRSPVRPTKSDQPSTSPTSGFADTLRTKVPSTTIPILSPKPAPAEVQASGKQEAPQPKLSSLDKPTPEQVSAAKKIQDVYRTHSARKGALKSISTLRKRFLAAKSVFTLPTMLDYETTSRAPDGTDTRAHITVTVDRAAALPSPTLSAADGQDADPFQHVPKLAYTPNNAPLHAYEEELNRILSALDAVESRGDAGVRAARRELARMVEREAERVERWRGVVWDWWTGRAKESPLVTSASIPAQEYTLESDALMSANRGESVEVAQLASTPEEQVNGTASEEPTMQVESVVVSEEATPTVISMEVEHDADAAAPDRNFISAEDPNHSFNPVHSSTSLPAPSAEAEQPPTPEIDIPDADADVEEPAHLVNIAVEPPSRADPVPLDAEAQDIETAESTTSCEASVVEEADLVESSWTASKPDRSSTPSLSNDVEADVEMEVEPQEVHTPPPGAHTPLVVADPPLADSHEQAEKVTYAEGEQEQARLAREKGGASPLVDRSWDDIRVYDIF